MEKNKTGRARKFSINQSFFKKIDSPEKAYFLGWVYADGTNSGQGVCIRLQEEDADVLKKLNKLINSNKPLILVDYSKTHPNWKKQYSLSLYSKKIAQDLEQIGCVKNKSNKNISFPEIPKELKRFFIRGFFEGDGCLYINPKTNIAQFYICGTEKLLKEIKETLIEGANCSNPELIKDKNSKRTYKLRYGGNRQITKILDWIYSGKQNLNLKRKYKKYKKLCTF